MKIHNLKSLMDKTLDDVTYLRDYGTITEELWSAYYYLWFETYKGLDIGWQTKHIPPESQETIQANLSPDNLLVFQEYVEKFSILK